MLSLIDESVWINHTSPWHGTADELKAALRGDHKNNVSGRAAKLLDSWRNACGTYLGRLAGQHPHRFKETRTATRREYTIYAPPDSAEVGD